MITSVIYWFCDPFDVLENRSLAASLFTHKTIILKMLASNKCIYSIIINCHFRFPKFISLNKGHVIIVICYFGGSGLIGVLMCRELKMGLNEFLQHSKKGIFFIGRPPQILHW